MAILTNRMDRKWWILCAMVLAQSAAFIDQAVIGVVQPTIQSALSLSTVTLVWITNIFFLAMAIFIGIGGRLGDIFKYKRVFLVGVAVFFFGSLLCVLSSGIIQLLISRFIQGVGVAILLPNTLVIIIRGFATTEKGKAMGLFLGLSFLSLVIGLFTGTALSEIYGWKVIFWLDMVLAVCSFFIAFYAIPANLSESQKFILDWKGLITYMIGVSALVYLLMQFLYLSGMEIIILTFLAIFFLSVCFYLEKNYSHPLIDFRIFENKLFFSAIILAFFMTAIFGLFSFDTLFYQQVLGYTPFAASFLFLPNILCQIIFALIGGWLYDKYGYRKLIVTGLSATIAGLLMNSYLVFNHNYFLLVPGIILINMGVPFIVTSARTLAITAVDKNDQGIASGVYNIFDILGGTVVVSILTLVIVSSYRHLLNKTLIKYSEFASFLTLDEFEKLLSKANSMTQIPADKLAQLMGYAKTAYTSAYSIGTLFCAALLTGVFITVYLIFRSVKKVLTG